MINDAVELGAPNGIDAASSGGATAHLMHRNGSNYDGALVSFDNHRF